MSGERGRSSSGVARHRVVVAEADLELRLDQLLAAHVPELSRRKARVLLEIGGVFVDGRRVKVASRKLRLGQRVEVQLGGALQRADPQLGRAARARDRSRLPPAEILYDDEHLTVIEKPAGLLSAATPESDRGHAAELLPEPDQRPVFVVHRLDMPTSGVLCFARSAEANRVLSEVFAAHQVDRRYRLLVWGQPTWFGEDPHRVEHAVGGRSARTDFYGLRRFASFTELEARLHTGRTHQIRLHCEAEGHSVCGDPQYGHRPAGAPSIPRMALHAQRLALTHPISGQELFFERPWPQDMADWLAAAAPDKELAT